MSVEDVNEARQGSGAAALQMISKLVCEHPLGKLTLRLLASLCSASSARLRAR
jgi:hypothetical protein